MVGHMWVIEVEYRNGEPYIYHIFKCLSGISVYRAI